MNNPPSPEPQRHAFSRAEMATKLKKWMNILWEGEPKDLEASQRDQYHRDLGLIYHFICDHFPTDPEGSADTPVRNDPPSIS